MSPAPAYTLPRCPTQFQIFFYSQTPAHTLLHLYVLLKGFIPEASRERQRQVFKSIPLRRYTV